MDHIMMKIERLVILSSVALPILCGAVGEFAVNIAYGKPTTQSSTYIGITDYGDTPGYPYDASLAVDGNTNTNFKSDGCSHTDLTSNSAWWEVHLLDLYNVLNITIYQRSDGNTDWLSGFVTKGKLSNDSFLIIYNPKSNMTGTITIPVNTSLKFKGIRIELNQKNVGIPAICLCEVEVMAEINVAEKKLAKQSSMYIETNTSFNASLAVDGNTYTHFAAKSCSCTNPGDLNPWWSVDLQAVYFVIGIRIYQRMDSQSNRLKGFTLVGVHANGSNETIQTPQPYQTGEIVIHVTPPRMLKEIRVHLNHSAPGEGPIITLCEVQVFAGTMCQKPPPFPRKGVYKYIPGNEGNWSYNFSLIINCIEGYIIDGPISVRCEDINRWNGTFGSCSVKRCNKPLPQVDHGILTFKNGIDGNVTYNTTVTLNCNEGYKRSTGDQLRCVDEDQWQGTLGHCMVKRCNKPPPQIAHGLFAFKDGIEGNATYNASVSMNCTEGYKRNSHAVLRCADDEQWQGTLGFCFVKQCEKSPPQIAHGVLTFKNGLKSIGTYNTTVSLTCTEGYKRNSHALLRCGDDEQWQGNLGLCLVKRCDEPLPQVSHGVLTFKDGLEGNGTYNTTVSLICNEGYKQNSTAVLRCADDEQYQGILGHCLVKRCDQTLPQVAHGILTFKDGIGGNATYNTTVTLNCNEGYKRSRDVQLSCVDEDHWQGTLGFCMVKKCNQTLPQVAHGILTFKNGIDGNGTYNATVTLNCNEGYKRSGVGQLRCGDEDQWQGTLGFCAESLRSGEHKSSVAGIAGGVTATIGAIIFGIIIAYFLYKRRARGTNDKMVETALNTIPSSSRRKGHNEEVILDTSIDAQPKQMKRAEIDETKHEYMNSMDSSRDYYSFTSQKKPDKHSIRVDDLSSFFLSRKMEPGLYEEEYSKLPNGLIKSHEEALRPENNSKNRYKHIYPYDDTRVRLEIWDPNIENDYINACYINGFKTVRAYIAAQGPTKGVLNDFWRMVWQTKCSQIVMLTNLIEEGKHKCEQYWPDEGSVEYGDIVIRLVECEKFSDFTIRTLELRKTVERTEEEKDKAIQVKQFHFTAWPDRGVPTFASSLNHFRHKIHTTKPRRNSKGPIVVHCSAGIGRTGTFLALDYLVQQAEEMGYINVVHCVENLRKQRVNLVQTLEQYIFLHEALVEALTCSTITMSTSEFQENYRTLLERNTKTGKRKLDDKFEKLTMYVSDPGEDVYANANVMENRDKNRYHNILPDKNHCPYLNVYVKGRDSYINAVFLSAYKDDNMFVVTQTPLGNTIVDFWRMVYQLEVSSIVMLNTLSEMKEEERYWTENDETLEIVPFRFTLESKTSDDICTNYTMLLKYHDERRKVRLSRATYWADKTNVPNSPTAMLKQIDLIQRWQQETCKKPVVVHCMNGAERSGLFCVVAALLERTKIEHDVAVEDIIKQMRSRRPQVIPNVDQFKFCYDAVSAYIDLFDTYSNFTGL